MNRDYVVGDVVLQRTINNEVNMVIQRVSKDAVKCRWFNSNDRLVDAYFSNSNIILLSEYNIWNKQQLRLKKLENIIK